MKNNNKIVVREIKEMEFEILEDMLYQSICQADEKQPISREVINIPEVRVYIDDFGQKKDDYCLVADLNGQIIRSIIECQALFYNELLIIL